MDEPDARTCLRAERQTALLASAGGSTETVGRRETGDVIYRTLEGLDDGPDAGGEATALKATQVVVPPATEPAAHT